MKIFLCILALAATAMSDPNNQQILQAGNEKFTAKMFNEVVKLNEGKSCVLSAFSVLSPLAQLALAAVGDSHDELLTAIGMPNDDVTKEVFSDVNTRLRSVKGVVLKQANKVYIRQNYHLNDEFATVSKDVFNSEIQNIDFTKAQASADEINLWVEDHTNKRIKNLVDPTTITDDTAAILVNAIYFKGSWKSPFEKYATHDRDFFLTETKNVSIPMMNQMNYFDYHHSSELNAKFLRLPYEGDETSFVVVLPNQYNGVDALIEKMKNPVAFSQGLKNMYSTNIDVTLPKFKIETTTDLKKVLTKMNVGKLFDERTARLDKLVQGEKDMYVSDAVQKAFIEVNEEGAEAAAANKFGIAFATSVGANYIEQFNANHPFLFFLMEKDNILFNGVFRS